MLKIEKTGLQWWGVCLKADDLLIKTANVLGPIAKKKGGMYQEALDTIDAVCPTDSQVIRQLEESDGSNNEAHYPI